MIHHSKPTIEKDDIKAVVNQLKTGMIAEGKRVDHLENIIQSYLDTEFVKSTSSGKSALIQALSLLELDKNDEVIIPTYVCRSVYDAIKYIGAKPIIVDVDDNYCISPKKIEENISKRTKVIIIVYIYGISAKVNEIMNISKGKDIIVIEDLAQGIGGTYGNRKLGNFGDIVFGSFQATKVLTSGEGGFYAINKKRSFNDNNFNKFDFRANISDLSASLAINQFGKLDDFITKRKKLASTYIKNLKYFKKIEIPIDSLNNSIFFRFPVKINQSFNFRNLRNNMQRDGIQIRKGVDKMLNQIDNNFSCPNADLLYKKTISLPIYPELKEKDVNYICQKLKKYI